MDSSRRQQCLDELDMELRSLEDSRNAASKHLAELDDDIRLVHLKKASLAPVNTLPDELLALILEEACIHNFSLCCHYRKYKVEQSIIVSHVSRRWRDLALAMPKIWQCIHLTSPGPPLYDNVIKLYLARSGQAPLSIVVADDTFDGDFEEPSVQPWLEQDRSMRRCWALLCTAGPRWTLCALFWNSHDVMELLEAEVSCVQLPNLRLEDCAFDTSPGLARLSTIFIAVVIARCRSIDSGARPRAEENNEPRLVFPSLRRLAVSGSCIDTGLSCFEAPLLEMLWLDRLGSEPVPFKLIRGPRFAEIYVSHCEFDACRPYFSSTVTTLDVTGSATIDSAYIRALMPTQDSLLLPNLHTLIVSDLDGAALSLLLDCVRARADMKKPLRTIGMHALTMSSNPPDDFLAALKMLGVDVQQWATVFEPLGSADQLSSPGFWSPGRWLLRRIGCIRCALRKFIASLPIDSSASPGVAERANETSKGGGTRAAGNEFQLLIQLPLLSG
ncbi:hypothetical protein BC835DRAFT_390672 [Cytidiella melzeri]|nr:hypothetical protein BC835DRAFT_390672 [Cytidiella melzeri]